MKRDPAPPLLLCATIRKVDQMTVIDEIAAERKRQIEGEGWSCERDDREHDDGGIAVAASCYAKHAARSEYSRAAWLAEGKIPRSWPWEDAWWKPKDPRRDLVRAAALIVAEIERLDRAAAVRDGGKG